MFPMAKLSSSLALELMTWNLLHSVTLGAFFLYYGSALRYRFGFMYCFHVRWFGILFCPVQRHRKYFLLRINWKVTSSLCPNCTFCPLQNTQFGRLKHSLLKITRRGFSWRTNRRLNLNLKWFKHCSWTSMILLTILPSIQFTLHFKHNYALW